MRRWWLSLLLVAALLGVSRPPSALAGVEVVNPQVAYTFGGQVTFRATIQSDVPIVAAQIFLRSQGESGTMVGTATLDPAGTLAYVHDLTQQPLRAFARVHYWFRLTPQVGEVYTSPEFWFVYEDNRFDWQTLQAGPLRVHWYEGDEAFGQLLLDVSRRGLEQAQKYLPVAASDEINIYAYASAMEMQSAQRLASQTWVAGHADAALSLIVVSLPAGPSQRMDAQRQIPHELMHILLYQLLGKDYDNLPIWLREGLASINELSPNPDYRAILDNAAEKETWLPLASLCHAFPTDMAGAQLAYAEADSFVRYLHGQYGATGLQALATNYANGLDCERGSEMALGKRLTQLETQWRREAFGRNETLAALGDLLPWAALLLLALAAPLGLALAGWGRGERRKAEG